MANYLETKKFSRKHWKKIKKEHGRLGLEPSAGEQDYIKNEYAVFELIRQFVFGEVIKYKTSWKNKRENTIY